MTPPRVLDATASGRHMWHDEMKESESVVYADRRVIKPGSIEQQETWACEPNIQLDVRQLPFQDDWFDLIAFDPPHRIKENGMAAISGFIEQKFGALCAETWQDDLEHSFRELWRVLRPGGTLTFKWADVDRSHKQVLRQVDETPLYGTTTQKGDNVVKWWVFRKPRNADGGVQQ